MSRVTFSIEDAGDNGLLIGIESADPPFPLVDGEPDVERFTPAQAAAWLAANAIGVVAESFATLVVDSPE